MKRLAWLTDIHLTWLDFRRRCCFGEAVVAERPDAVLVGGDIADAQAIVLFLEELDELFRAPIYFVLGNHDYYGGSISRVRSSVAALSRESNNLTWLPEAGVVELSPSTGLVGHGEWADARNGDYRISPGLLNDYYLIEELAELSDGERQGKLFELGDEAADYFRDVLSAAFERYRGVIALTHVPPFSKAAWYMEKTSDDEHLPHFSSKAAGEVTVEIVRAHPEGEPTVLCGDTHGGGRAQILDNLLVLTGPATYGEPAVQSIIEINSDRGV